MKLKASLSAILLSANALGCSPGEEEISGGVPAYEVSLAVAPEGTFVAWHGGSGQVSRIYIRELDEQDRPRGEAIAVSDGTALAYEPDLVAAMGRLFVAWYEKDPETGKLIAWVAGLSSRGKREWMTPLAAGGDLARNPVVRLVGDHLEAAWIEQPEKEGDNRSAIWHQRIAMSGATMTQPQRIGDANRDTWNLNASVHGDRFVVVYDAALQTRAHELHMLTVTAGEVRHLRLSDDDGHASLYPDLQFGPGGVAAITWFDERDGNQEVYLAVSAFDRIEPDVTPSAAVRVTRTVEPSIGAYLAWNGPVIGLAWSDDFAHGRDLYAQAFTADGRALGPIRRLGPARETAGVPAIRASGPGFLVVWNDYVMEGKGTHGRVALSRVRLARLIAGT